MADAQEKLEPCPFCGGINIVAERDDPQVPPFVIWCLRCGASIDADTDCLDRGEKLPFDRWNTRALQSSPAPVEGEITRADREAAWPYRPPCYKGDPVTRHNWHDGVYDKLGVIQAFASHRQSGRNEALEEAAKGLLARMSSTYTARNGRQVGIEADDGEKCFIVHSDDIFALEHALKSQGGNHGG